jgi:hypothetical protein
MESIAVAQIQNLPVVMNVIKVLATGLLAFLLAFLLTPLWTHLLYKYKFGIRIKENGVAGDKLTFVSNLHAWKSGTPTMGGVLVWVTVLILAFASEWIFPTIANWLDTNFIARLDFLKRSQTWLPLFTLVTAGILGLIDDYMSVRGIRAVACVSSLAFGGSLPSPVSARGGFTLNSAGTPSTSMPWAISRSGGGISPSSSSLSSSLLSPRMRQMGWMV